MSDSGHVTSPSYATAVSAVTDDYLERYICWREACADVRAAYDDWRHAERTDRDGSFFAYSAALDREECAAREFRELAQRLGSRVADLAQN